MGVNGRGARARNTEQSVAVLVHLNAVYRYAAPVTVPTGASHVVMRAMTSNHPIHTDACERAAVSRAQVIGTR